MTDRQLLELAAKAAGLEICWADGYDNDPLRAEENGSSFVCWDPLTDDGDAFRLAARLKLNISQGDFSAAVSDELEIDSAALVRNEDERCEVLRGLIVRAAAAIGKEMP